MGQFVLRIKGRLHVILEVRLASLLQEQLFGSARNFLLQYLILATDSNISRIKPFIIFRAW